jgi:hypothetical protein
MASAVGKFFGEFGLDIDPFLKSVREIERETKSIENSIKPLKNLMEDAGKSFLVMGGAITGTFALMVKQSADYGEQLNKVSIQTGITTEQLSGLKHAADQNETSFESLTIGLKKMSTAADTNSAVFKEIGVRVADAGGHLRPMNEILLDVADRFSKMADGTKKSALAVDLFGRSGTDLIPTLNLGRKGLEEMGIEADKLGLSMSGTAAHAADDFNDSLSRMKDATLGLSNSVSAALAPALKDIVDWVTKGIISLKDFAKEHEGLTRAVAILGAGLTGAGGLLVGLAGIVTIAPKVLIGLQTITGGLTALSAEAVISTAGFAALAYWWYALEKAAADQQKQSESRFNTEKKAIEQTFENVKALAKLGIVLDQGTQSWKEYSDRVAVAAAIHHSELAKMAQDAKDAFNIDMRSKEEILAAKKKQADQLAAIDKDIREKATVMAGIAHDLNQIYFRDEVDAKRKQADELNALAKKVSDFQRSLLQVDDGLVNASIDEQIKKKKDQADTLIGLQKKIAEFNKAVLQVEDNQINDQIKAAKKRADEQKKAAEETAQAWANAMANLSTRTAEALSKMVVDFKFTSASLIGIAKQTAEGMLSAFLSGLIHPLTSALGSLGAGLSNSLMGALGKGAGIGGAMIPGTGFLSAFKGLFGGGAPAGEKAVSDAAGNLTSAGSAGGAAGFGLFGLSGAATLGIGAAIAGVGLLVNHFVGQGRRAENAFTSGSQGQFDKDLGNVFNQFQSQRAGGTLTLDSATALQKQITDLLSGITDDANAFAAKGKTEKKVIDNFFAQQQQLFGKDWVNLTSQINDSIANLKSKAVAVQAGTASPTGPLAGIPDTGRAVSASSIFASAVDVFKSVVDRIGGGAGGAVSAPVSVTVNPSNQMNFTVTIDDLAFLFRDVVGPQMLNDMSLDMNSITTKVLQIIKSRLPGVVTTGGAVA